MHSFGFPVEQSGFESKDPSSAVTLCGVPSSMFVTVTLPVFVASGSGLNLKFWMAITWAPAATEVPVAAVVPVELAVVAEEAAVVGLVDDCWPDTACKPTSRRRARSGSVSR